MKSRRALLLFIVSVAVLVSLSGLIAPSPAGSAENTPDSPSSEVKDISFIPVAEISTRVNEIKGRLREIEKNLSETGWKEKIQKVLSEKATEISSGKDELETAFSEGINVFELRNMRSDWTGLRGGLIEQEQIIGERTTQFDAWLGETESQIALWERTKKKAQRASAPKTVLQELDGTIMALKTMEKKLRKDRDTVLNLQSRIRNQLYSVESTLERIHDQQDILRRSFFERQDSPVWKMQIQSEEITGELKGLVNILRKEISDVLTHIDLNIGQVIVRFLLIALLLWLVRWTRDVLKKHKGGGKVPGEDAETGTSPPDIPAHPIAEAILLGLTLNLIFYFDSPTGFQVLIVIAALPVWLSVLGLLPAVQIAPLAVLAALVVVQIFLSYADQYPFLSRLLIFIESVIGLVLIRVIRHSVGYKRTGQLMGKNIWFRVVDFWLKVMFFAFSAGLGASLLGYRGLAITLAGLAIWGAFIGTLLLCAVRILEVIVLAIVDAGKLDRLKMILIQPERFLMVTRRGMRVLAFFTWIYYVFETLTLWDPLRESATRLLSASFGYGAFTFSLGGLFAFGFTLWISWILSRFVSYVLDREVFTRLRMPPGIPFALTSFSRYTILVIGVIIALATLGIPMDRLALIISALGVGIGFGLQNVVNNFVSGIILLFERPIRVGDKVELEGLYGTVTDIGIRASNVRNFDGADVIVPNGDFISARVINWTLADRKRRVILPVGVKYGTDPTKVLEILESVARSHVEILVDPVPEALFRGFGESSLDFELRAWTESERGWPPVKSDLAVATYDALTQAGIEIPFPQRDLHLRSVDPEVHKSLSGEIPADELREEKEGDE
jgi:small-conductance mechanosensitive channel